MSVFSLAAPFLLQVGRTLPDTVLTRQVGADIGFFQKVAIFGSTILAIGILLLGIGLVIAAWDLRKTYKELHLFLERMHADLTPVIRNANLVADDVRDITTTVKGNVRQVQQTVASANSRIQNAVRDTEAQIKRFNAFIGVVQDEAESAFVSTASAVRGVRTGLEKMVDHNDDDLEDFEDADAEFEQPAREKPKVRSRSRERFS